MLCRLTKRYIANFIGHQLEASMENFTRLHRIVPDKTELFSFFYLGVGKFHSGITPKNLHDYL
jgi:hypothetical protein